MSAPVVVRSSHLSKIDSNSSSNSSVDYNRQHHSDDPDDMESCVFHGHTTTTSHHHIPGLGGVCSLRTPLRPDHHLGAEFDYDSAVRASYFGRRIYPSFDPSHIHVCPIRFIRQFEHAAQHNGLQMKAWAKRLNSCLQGRAEDWAFDECPLEVSGGMSWDTRKRQFLDWALLPAEQELRRQRLLRFYQLESDLSIDYVYSFEEAARGLRDYKEDVWVRKCIANLMSPLRSALFELWPDGLPVRFRDLRDSLYAVDWNLYEAASVPLKVVKFGTPYVYEVYNITAPLSLPQLQPQQQPQQQQPAQSQPQQQQPQHAPISRVSMSSSRDRRSQGSRPSMSAASASALGGGGGAANMYSPLAPSPSYPPTKLKQRSVVLSAAPATTGASQAAAAAAAQQRLFAAASHALASSAPTPPPETSSTKPPSSSEAAVTAATATTTASRTAAALAAPPAAAAGLHDLMQTLSRISEKERAIIMAALEKITGGEDLAPTPGASASGTAPPAAPIGIAIASPKQSKSRTRLAPAPAPASPASRLPSSAKAGGHPSRAAAAAAIAATAQFACADGVPRLSASVDSGLSAADSASSSDHSGGGGGRLTSRSSGADDKEAAASASGSSSSTSSSRQRAKGATAAVGGRPSGDEFGAATSPLPGGKIRLRTRPLTSMACCSRRQSSPFIDSRGASLEHHNLGSATPSPTSFVSPVIIPELPCMPAATSNAALRVAEHAAAQAAAAQAAHSHSHQTHARKLSNRKSDSALTTATRSMRAVENGLYYRDSVDNALRSPEFTVLHPAIDLRTPHSRRGRFAFIKKLSHMLTTKD